MKLQEVISKDNMGLYRDDGLAIVKGSGPEVERLQKKIVKIFQEENLKVTMEANTTAVDFLDVVFDLANGNHIPFIKQNENTKDVYMMSSHPPSILKSISTGVCNRLSIISTGEQEFKLEVGHYQDALREAGYINKLTYMEKPQSEDEQEQEEKNRPHNILWFNPPWSSNVRANVAAKFLSLVRKHFLPSSPLHTIFNTKKIKVSYSTCPNMKTYIASHNAKGGDGGG